MKKTVWIAVALAALTLAVYWPVTGFQFVNLDDPDFVTANPHVRAGLTSGNFKWAWGSEVAGNWHPITMLTLMLDCQLFGVNPWWPHLVNVLLHAANTVLLFGLFKRMTGALWRSAIVAALFALHPLHVESVAWVSERKDVLSTLFWLLGTWAYVRHTEHRKYSYGLSLMFFALGLMSKPMLVTLPFTLLVLDFWPLKRRAVVEKIPYFVMSAALCVVTLRTQKQNGAMPLLENVTVGERLGNALVSYARYIEKMFWPRNLAGLYPLRLGQWPWWEVALAALLLLAITALVLTQWRRRPYLAAGWLWYLGTLVPVIGLVQVGNQAMADRYTYVPLIGLFVMAVWGGWELAVAWRLARFIPAATAAALAACAVSTAHQEFYWKDSEALNKRMIDVTKDNYIAHYHLGVALGEQGRIDEAISQYQEAVRLMPSFAAAAHYNLGLALSRKGQMDEAIKQFGEAIRFKPEFAEAHDKLGSALAMKGQIDQAISQFKEAARLDPDLAEARDNLARAQRIKQGGYR